MNFNILLWISFISFLIFSDDFSDTIHIYNRLKDIINHRFFVVHYFHIKLIFTSTRQDILNWFLDFQRLNKKQHTFDMFFVLWTTFLLLLSYNFGKLIIRQIWIYFIFIIYKLNQNLQKSSMFCSALFSTDAKRRSVLAFDILSVQWCRRWFSHSRLTQLLRLDLAFVYLMWLVVKPMFRDRHLVVMTPTSRLVSVHRRRSMCFPFHWMRRQSVANHLCCSIEASIGTIANRNCRRAVSTTIDLAGA